MHTVSNINRVSLYSSEEEDGVDDVTQGVDATYCNTSGTTEKIVERALKSLEVHSRIKRSKIDHSI